MRHLPEMNCQTIPHSQHRYETVGDYWEDSHGARPLAYFRVSRMGSDYEFLVLMHELIEWYLVRKKGINIKDIDEFDIEFEKNRRKGDDSEPGDSRDAPYRKEHGFATKVERLLARKLGVDWKEYGKHILSL